MSAQAVRRRDSMAPAFGAAVALHLLVFAIFAFWLKPPTVIPLGSAVPINIVSTDTKTDSRPAERAPEVQAAATETPAPEAPPTPTPAPPQPVKATPAPQKPTPTPVTPAVKPSPVKPTPTTQSNFSLDALQASIDKAARAQPKPAKPSPAPQGPTRAELDRLFRAPAGEGLAQSQLEGLQQLLGRLWNPCVVVGGEQVKLKATFAIGPEGRVAGQVSVGGAERSSDPVTFAAARRAIDAVHQVEPYAEPFRGQRITVNFDAQRVCAGH